MKLTPYEQEMLDGTHGRLKQVALENIVSYAEILGADELCTVTKATVFCGNHAYQSACNAPDFETVFTEMNLCRSEKIVFDEIAPECHAQTCVAPCDMYDYKTFNQSEEFFNRNNYFVEECSKAGVIIAGTCSPYLNGWIPVKGEHFVTTESSMTTLGNSLWGACCNSDGIEAAFWSAICGRTPKWGYHTDEYRKGTHLVEVKTELHTIIDWEVLGTAIGKKLPPNANPVLVGEFKNVDFNKIRCFLVALSIASNCRMVHIVGVTPEAATVEMAFGGNEAKDTYVITDEEMQAAYDSCTYPGESDEIELVSLGCPHYDIDQIKKVAEYMKGKKVKDGLLFMVWTEYPIKHMADINGFTKIIEEAGGHIFTSTCPTTIGDVFLSKHKAHVYDSNKQAGSVRSEFDGPVFYTDMYNCMEIAITGTIKEENKWKR